jgi:hypothetical protein
MIICTSQTRSYLNLSVANHIRFSFPFANSIHANLLITNLISCQFVHYKHDSCQFAHRKPDRTLICLSQCAHHRPDSRQFVHHNSWQSSINMFRFHGYYKIHEGYVSTVNTIQVHCEGNNGEECGLVSTAKLSGILVMCLQEDGVLPSFGLWSIVLGKWRDIWLLYVYMPDKHQEWLHLETKPNNGCYICRY